MVYTNIISYAKIKWGDGMTIGERIKKVRLARGFTQKQVADSCGMADSAIRKYESGKVTPKYEMLQRIASALGVHPGELMGLKNYGDNIWAPEGLTSDDLEDIRHRALAISENQKMLNRLKERMAKKEHITGKLELLNDDGLDTAVQAIDTIVGNPRLSTYPSSPPYFHPTPPTEASQDASKPPAGASRDTDTPAPLEGAEGPQEGE